MSKPKNEAVKELAYKTLIRPQVEYVSSFWSPQTKQNLSKIEMTQSCQMDQKQQLHTRELLKYA